MLVNTRRGAMLAALSLTLLVPGSFCTASAAAQPPATGAAAGTANRNAQRQAGRRTPRVNPLNEALKSLDLAAEQKSKIEEIRAQTQKDLDAAPGRGTPERQAKVRELNAKMAADIKASLPADLQTKFQTAFDAAEAKNAEQARAAGLRDFKRPLETLSLTPEEQAKVDPIAKEAYDKVFAVRQDTALKGRERNAKIETIISGMKTKVRPVLALAKQAQLDALDLTPRTGQGARGRTGNRRNSPAGAAGTKTPGAPPAL